MKVKDGISSAIRRPLQIFLILLVCFISENCVTWTRLDPVNLAKPTEKVHGQLQVVYSGLDPNAYDDHELVLRDTVANSYATDQKSNRTIMVGVSTTPDAAGVIPSVIIAVLTLDAIWPWPELHTVVVEERDTSTGQVLRRGTSVQKVMKISGWLAPFAIPFKWTTKENNLQQLTSGALAAIQPVSNQDYGDLVVRQRADWRNDKNVNAVPFQDFLVVIDTKGRISTFEKSEFVSVVRAQKQIASANNANFSDTVLLKSGETLTNVKATVTRDSVIVTDSSGGTRVFTKDQVAGVKTGTSASPNVGFGDTVMLKSGETLSSGKATVTRDSVIVTDASGNTRVLQKDQVAGVKTGAQ